jgi:hypothetical protein
MSFLARSLPTLARRAPALTVVQRRGLSHYLTTTPPTPVPSITAAESAAVYGSVGLMVAGFFYLQHVKSHCRHANIHETEE